MYKLKITRQNFLLITSICFALSGCASNNGDFLKVNKSVLASADVDEQDDTMRSNTEIGKSGIKLEKIPSIANDKLTLQKDQGADTFSTTKQIKVAFSSMKISDFIHQIFGKTLGVNYVVGQKVVQLQNKVTLNVTEGLSERVFYQNVKQLLDENAVEIRYKSGVYYFYSVASNKQRIVTSVGRTISSVPSTTAKILQIIPLKYGVNLSLERTIKQLIRADVSFDASQSAIFVQGTRDEIIQVIELVSILDRPANQGKHIGFLELNFISTDDFISAVNQLLKNEGVPTDLDAGTQKNLALVPLPQIGAIAIFTSEEEFLKRVEFWATKLDKAPQGDTKQYFIYRPKFARAQDIGDSLIPLIGGQKRNSSQQGNSARDTKSAVANKVAKKGANYSGNEDMSVVIDQRANFVIFHTTGTKYQEILPLIRSLDVMPKQVLLEVTIAEVTLRDEFQYGVEYFFQDGDFTFSTSGSLGLEDISGAVLSSVGVVNNINARLIARNNLVNVLSNPTLLVRDGTTASIIVGDEIPLITSTDTNDETGVVRNNVSRRQTGLELTVKPTINTKGVVIMEIEQSMSNQASGTQDGILNRSINTEVVANSGATILLGGLISENASNSESKVPLLGDIPLLGNLFKTVKEGTDKTELIILVTPRVIYDQSQWDEIKINFQKGVENIKF